MAMIKITILYLVIFLSLSVSAKNNIETYLNEDGSLKTLTSTVKINFPSADETSIREAIVVAKETAKANLSLYITREVSVSKNLQLKSDQDVNTKNYFINIESNSNTLLKNINLIDQVINEQDKYVSITLGINFKKIKNTAPPKTAHRNFKDYLKSLIIPDSVVLKNFMGKQYTVSLASKKLINSTPRVKINTMKVTKTLARVNLLKFLYGDNINYNSILARTNVTKISPKGKITSKLDKSLIETIQTGVALATKDKGIDYLWYVEDGVLFHYAYVKSQ